MRRLLLVLPILCALLLPLATSVQAKPRLGIADNNNLTFADPRLAQLKLKYARINIPWDILSDKSAATKASLSNVDLWMARTHKLKYQVLVSFDRSRNPDRISKNPSSKQLTSALKKWQKRWYGKKFIRTISTWNEPNLNKQPKLIGKWYDALVKSCKSCTILPGELVDATNLVSYAKRVDRYAKRKIKIWGLHSYVDANTFSTKNIKKFAKSTKKTIWMTETNGVVSRTNTKRRFKGQGVAFQAQATQYLLSKVAKATGHLKRIYIYSWGTGAPAGATLTFDSALINGAGQARPALNVVRAYLGLPADPSANAGD